MAPGRRGRSGSRGRDGGGIGGAASSSAGARGPQGPTVKKARKDIFANELGYKDESNPFGDNTLTDKFVWTKRNEYLQAAGLYKKSSKEQEVERIESKIREIHQVKKRRDEREVERRLLEEQRAEHDRERHDELFDEWLDNENKFHLESARARSLIRIEQGRERPMDLCVKELAIADGDEFEDMTILETPPFELFGAVSLKEAEDMMNDIELNLKADKEHQGFWKAMLFACQEAVDGKQREKAGGPGFGAGVAEGVVSEIHELLSSKSKSELEDMMIEIKGSLKQGGAGMDTQFFEAVAAKIPLFMAQAEILEWHTKAQKKINAWLKVQQGGGGGGEAASSSSAAPAKAAPVAAAAGSDEEGDWDDLPGGAPPGSGGDLSPELEPLSVLDEKGAGASGAYSPVLEPLSNYNDQDLLDPEEDERIMRQVRQTLMDAFGHAGGASGSSDGLDRKHEDDMVAAEKARGMANGETSFNAPGKGNADEFHGEVALPTKHYEWEDKYKPRKPRFFNRVKTGYEWNKYNQTHYDHDNPPPKRVQGYKFNVFYPDLIDKTKAPKYYLEKDDSNNETVTLRFHAGPPYEDVAFKIVNCEWNVSHKFGFRVVFDRGVLQLYFNFKRWRYRR